MTTSANDYKVRNYDYTLTPTEESKVEVLNILIAEVIVERRDVQNKYDKHPRKGSRYAQGLAKTEKNLTIRLHDYWDRYTNINFPVVRVIPDGCETNW